MQTASDRFQQEIAQTGQGAAHDDDFGVEQVGDIGQFLPDRHAGVVQDAENRRTAAASLRDDVFGRLGGMFGPGQQGRHDGGGGDGFQAAAVTATADRAVLLHGRMADFPGDADISVVGGAVDDQTGADA